MMMMMMTMIDFASIDRLRCARDIVAPGGALSSMLKLTCIKFQHGERPPSLGMSPTDIPRRGSSRQRRGRARETVLGGTPNVASDTLLRRARTIGQVSGAGSDDDRESVTLRKKRNAARQRRSGDDDMLPGPILLQRVLPAGSVIDTIEVLMTAARTLERAGHGIVMMMMMTMVAKIRAFTGDTRVRQAAWGTGGASDNTLTVMPMVMTRVIIKTLAVGGGPKFTRATETGRRRRLAMMMMTIIIMVVNRAASMAAGIPLGRREKLGRCDGGQVSCGPRRLKRKGLLKPAAATASQPRHRSSLTGDGWE
jgi:hypothetical protein